MQGRSLTLRGSAEGLDHDDKSKSPAAARPAILAPMGAEARPPSEKALRNKR